MDVWNVKTGDYLTDEFLDFAFRIQFYYAELPSKNRVISDLPRNYSNLTFILLEDKLGLKAEFWDLQGPQEIELEQFYREFTLLPECGFWEKYWAVSRILKRCRVRHSFIWRGDKLFLKFCLKPKHVYAHLLSQVSQV